MESSIWSAGTQATTQDLEGVRLAIVARWLWVGARAKMHFRPAIECVCCHAECQQQQPVPLQTLSHVLLECPVAREVWDWFEGKCRQLAPE